MTETKAQAPPLPEDASLWLNTGGQAVSLEKGILYLLDFWTYSCVNCLRVLQDLRYLETKHAGRPFRIIGVHSGKFDNEKDAANLRNAILRHDIRHPVVRDDNYRIWRDYGVHAWPTLALVDPEGYYIGSVSGEGKRESLDEAIGQLLDIYVSEGVSPVRAPAFQPTLETRTDSPLAYPGKVLADAPGNRLFIADTRHNRLVVCALDGANAFTIGSGEAGRADGDFATATFRGPQGMALIGEALFVCDTENHLLRRVDLAQGVVTTVAGTGQPMRARVTDGAALQTPLSSPWDLCAVGGPLTIAMAGTHQLWRFDPQTGALARFAGTGREARRDGPAREANFAQPSGVTGDESALYVADSETSSIRRIALTDDCPVSTLAGGDLFDFGDIDGVGEEARLQHPLGVALGEGVLFIADAYNHKIKRLDLASRLVSALAGDGTPGLRDGDAARSAQFYEPGGLSLAGDQVYIADTNNHRIRVLNLTAQTVSTLEIPGLCSVSLRFPPGSSEPRGVA